MKVAIYQIREHHRSQIICDAMAKGITRCGDQVLRRWEERYATPEADVAVFYGLEGNLPRIFEDHKLQPHAAVYVDLGYWGRRQGGRWAGWHKVVVNARHPTSYYQARRHDASRAAALNVVPQPWKNGRHVLIAGMGDKGARAEGFEPEQWERAAIAQLRQHTDRAIVYRPKPSWKTARAIEGVGYSPRTQDVAEIMRGCHAVVTHHSNVAVDGIVGGIPAFVWYGVGSTLGSQDLESIESPRCPTDAERAQWICDIAWCQWSIEEMSRGLPWRHLKEEGLIP